MVEKPDQETNAALQTVERYAAQCKGGRFISESAHGYVFATTDPELWEDIKAAIMKVCEDHDCQMGESYAIGES